MAVQRDHEAGQLRRRGQEIKQNLRLPPTTVCEKRKLDAPIGDGAHNRREIWMQRGFPPPVSLIRLACGAIWSSTVAHCAAFKGRWRS